MPVFGQFKRKQHNTVFQAEAMAINLALQTFNIYYQSPMKIVIFTDNKSVVKALKMSESNDWIIRLLHCNEVLSVRKFKELAFEYS